MRISKLPDIPGSQREKQHVIKHNRQKEKMKHNFFCLFKSKIAKWGAM
jgi:hypothetical protein